MKNGDILEEILQQFSVRLRAKYWMGYGMVNTRDGLELFNVGRVLVATRHKFSKYFSFYYTRVLK